MLRGGYELSAVILTFVIAMYEPPKALDFAMMALVALAAYRFIEKPAGNGDADGNDVNAERVAHKEKNIARVLAAARAKGDITNHEVQALLGVSDATATRYLEELEQQGHLSQAGRTGSHVHYNLR